MTFGTSDLNELTFEELKVEAGRLNIDTLGMSYNQLSYVVEQALSCIDALDEW